jgi:hypothetical protein
MRPADVSEPASCRHGEPSPKCRSVPAFRETSTLGVCGCCRGAFWAMRRCRGYRTSPDCMARAMDINNCGAASQDSLRL